MHFRKLPDLLVPCYVFHPADIGVVKVPNKDQSRVVWRRPHLLLPDQVVSSSYWCGTYWSALLLYLL